MIAVTETYENVPDPVSMFEPGVAFDDLFLKLVDHNNGRMSFQWTVVTIEPNRLVVRNVVRPDFSTEYEGDFEEMEVLVMAAAYYMQLRGELPSGTMQRITSEFRALELYGYMIWENPMITAMQQQFGAATVLILAACNIIPEYARWSDADKLKVWHQLLRRVGRALDNNQLDELRRELEGKELPRQF